MHSLRSVRRRSRFAPGLLWMAGALLLVACERPKPVIPDELIGTWTTSDSRYAGRALQFMETTVLFHTGPGRFEVSGFGVVDVETVERAGGLRGHEIRYQSDGDVVRLVVVVDPGRGTLTLESQPTMIWRRVGQESTGGLLSAADPPRWR